MLLLSLLLMMMMLSPPPSLQVYETARFPDGRVSTAVELDHALHTFVQHQRGCSLQSVQPLHSTERQLGSHYMTAHYCCELPQLV
jgi:hypothetical protein